MRMSMFEKEFEDEINFIKLFRKISCKLAKYGFDVCDWNNQKLKAFFEAHEEIYLKSNNPESFGIYFLGLLRENAKKGDEWARGFIISLSMHAILTNTENKKPISVKLENRPLREL